VSLNLYQNTVFWQMPVEHGHNLGMHRNETWSETENYGTHLAKNPN